MVDTVGQCAEFILTVVVNAIAQVAASNSLRTTAQHTHRIKQPIDHEIVDEKHEAGKCEPNVENGEICGVLIERALIEIEIVTVAANYDHVFAVARPNLRVIG